jgi:hypothetical protein
LTAQAAAGICVTRCRLQLVSTALLPKASPKQVLNTRAAALLHHTDLVLATQGSANTVAQQQRCCSTLTWYLLPSGASKVPTPCMKPWCQSPVAVQAMNPRTRSGGQEQSCWQVGCVACMQWGAYLLLYQLWRVNCTVALNSIWLCVGSGSGPT